MQRANAQPHKGVPQYTHLVIKKKRKKKPMDPLIEKVKRKPKEIFQK